MKVLLINPPSDNEIIGNNPQIIEEERGHNPPLGLLFIAGYLERFTDYSVEILDCQVEKLTYPKIEELLEKKKYDIVGITVMTFTLLDALKVARIVKKTNKNTRLVFGGPHVHIFPDETIHLPDVDYLVLGEGEQTFKELLDHIDDTKKLKTIRGLVFKENGGVVNTGLRDFIQDLDELPFPARHLTPYRKYSSLLARRTPVTTMMTSRGCPYKCSFCDRPQLGKKFRARSAQNVVDEMEECVKMGIHEFIIYDDTFTINKQRVKEICAEIIRRKLDIGWDIRARVDSVDESLLEKLKRAGCRGIHYGVESGTTKILKILNKRITIPEIEEAFSMTKKQGIMTLAYFMIGNPTETEEDILKTIEFAKKLDPDFIHLTIFTPFPATKIYLEGLEKRIIEKDYWRDFAKNPCHTFVPPYWKENFTIQELNELLVYAYKSFYTRPNYILRRLMKVQSLGEFKRKMKAGIKVFKMK